jgi:hypothetical protein
MVVPNTLTAAVLTFESRTYPVDHMQTPGTNVAPQSIESRAVMGCHVTFIPWR